MPTIQPRLLTPQEYLTQERRAEFRSEYLRGEVFAMAGVSHHHTLIKDNLAGEARSQLKNRPCRTLTSDQRVKVNVTGLYTYPDIVIVCDEPQFEDARVDTLLNPRVIVEVLSESTEKYDRGARFGHYRQFPTLQEYVLVAHDRYLVERYVRQPDNSWLLTVFDQPTASFSMTSIPVTIPLAEIYRGVKFEPLPPDEPDSRP